MSKPDLLESKVIIVTGAGQGVGMHIALEAARLGARVVVNDLGLDQDGNSTAENTVAAIKNAGGNACASLDDIAEWDQAEKLIATAIDNFGQLDGLVNNAGILRDKIFHKLEKEDFEKVIAVNLTGCYNTSRLAAPIFKEQNSGSYVHMTSTSGLVGNLGQANYSASKTGLIGLSKSIALDMQRFNVRSNLIAPFALTPMTASGVPKDTEEGKARWRILERMAPEKVSALTCALMADESAHVSGQIFGARGNEVYLFSQPRPVRTMHIGDEGGISAQAVIDRVLPAFMDSFYSLERSLDIFTWDPV